MVATRILMVASSHMVGELNLTFLVNISDKASLSAALGTGLFGSPSGYVFLEMKSVFIHNSNPF